jgi:hypothetical protein
MKHMLAVFLLTTLVVAPAFVCAQEPPDGPAPDEALGEPGPDRGPGHGGAMVERWLERLREKDPEEFGRLQKLREKDPEAFRKHLHQTLREERAMAALRDFPKLHEFVQTLPPDEREQILRRLSPPGGGDGPHGFQPRMNPEIRNLDQKTLELSRAYRGTTDAAHKEKIRTDLKEKLGALFDLRERERQAHVERIESDLVNLKNSITDRRAHREEIVERRLVELTDGDDLGW